MGKVEKSPLFHQLGKTILPCDLQSLCRCVALRRWTRIWLALAFLVVIYLQLSVLQERQENNVVIDDVVRMRDVEKLMKIPNQLKMEDEDLVSFIKQRLLDGPSSEPYNFAENITKGQHGQVSAIDEHFASKRGGFFIEAGAWNGEYLSNSLFLEVERGWTGLLVEANPKAYASLRKKHRKAHSINACLSLNIYPELVTFDGADVFGGVVNNSKVVIGDDLSNLRKDLKPEFRASYEVQCLPIFSILLALGNPTVDYFSLDVEGSELPILQTIPWSKVDIRTFTVEINHSSAESVVDFMQKQGYKKVREFDNIDIMFAKER